MFLVSSCSYFCPIQHSQVLSREWRCSWNSADRRCSNYIWVIDNFIAYWCASYIRELTVHSKITRDWHSRPYCRLWDVLWWLSIGCLLRNPMKLWNPTAVVDRLGGSPHTAMLWPQRKTWWRNDLMTWTTFPRYWPFVGEYIRHRWILLTKGQYREVLMIPLLLAWTSRWTN